MLVRDRLNDAGMVRRAAASITLAFWPEWTEALAYVGHPRLPIVFAVAERDDGAWWCGNGRADQLADFVAEQSKQSPLKRLHVVTVARILDDMHKRAAKAGLDLSAGSVILPPDDPQLVEWLREFRAPRDAAQRKFDPLHAKPPPRPSTAMRAQIEALSCSLH